MHTPQSIEISQKRTISKNVLYTRLCDTKIISKIDIKFIKLFCSQNKCIYIEFIHLGNKALSMTRTELKSISLHYKKLCSWTEFHWYILKRTLPLLNRIWFRGRLLTNWRFSGWSVLVNMFICSFRLLTNWRFLIFIGL